VDKFEADQVLSYEGEALSPVLDPVFRAGQPVDLQIYCGFIRISRRPARSEHDVMNEGRVVAHMSLPFKSGLANSAREGPTTGRWHLEHGWRASP